ncbi:hypothetical protein GCM10027275_11190 [Rhabdobacter roseus]
MILAVMVVGLTVLAQPHHNAWLRATGSVPLAEGWKADAELQHRRQSGWGNTRPCHEPLLSSLRLWVHYTPNSPNPTWQLSASPGAYYRLYKLITSAEDANKVPMQEFRVSAAIARQDLLARALFLTNRTALEYRFFDQLLPVLRLRQRLGVRYDHAAVSVAVYNELLTNPMGVPTGHFFDHNRLGGGVQWRVERHLEVEAGYLYIHRLPLTNLEMLRERNFFLNLTYRFVR